MRAQDRREQRALSAADIDDAIGAAEIPGSGDGVADAARNGGHGLVEDRGLVGVMRTIVPDVGAMEVAKGVLAGPHAVEQVPPGLPIVRPSDEGSPRTDRLARFRGE